MKMKISKKPILLAFVLCLLFVCSFAAELLVFNRQVLALPAEGRVVRDVSFYDLKLEDMEFGEDGWFVITGEQPRFSLGEDNFVSKVLIATNGETQPMHIAISNDDKVYDVDSRFKGISVLRVNDTAENVWFEVSLDNGEDRFTIDSVSVDNRLNINWLRVLLMCSVCLIVWFFVCFYRIAVSKLHVSFLVIALTVGMNLALATPVWYGLDEHAHYVRAYQFANFNLGFDHEEKLSWINEMEDFFYQTGALNSRHHNYDERQAFIQSFSTNEYGMREYFPTTAATYPFVPYFFAGLGILVAKLLGMPFIYTFYAGRIFNVLGYALICFFAIRTAKTCKRLLFMMSLVPYALFSSAVYTADTLTVSFAVLSIALFVNMLTAEDGSLDYKLPLGFGLCCAAMAMCKLPYAPLCLLALTVPLKKFASTKDAIRNFVVVFAAVGVISVATLLFGADKGIIQWYQPGMSIVGQVKYILTHPFRYLMTMIHHGVGSWMDYLFGSTWKMGYCKDVSNLWAGLTVLGAVLLSVVDYEPENDVFTWLQKLACVVAAACSWVLVLTALYVSFNVVGAEWIDGVQGRYFYPLVLPLLLLLKNKKFGVNLNKIYLNTCCFLFSGAMGVAAVIHVFADFCM